ncbi:MAG: hypothetical protein AWM53_01038 [Candidatus Dichloromethanomonas elyunquensis]|nr:MAG: hypothetical protein AWM53_01038 [Candidatus Dichloromethanomonas elyunquensis]
MGSSADVRHYFLEAFTPFGFISFAGGLLKDMNYTYFLTGGPGTGKSTMIKLIGIQLIDRGYDVDYIRSIKEPDSVAGFFLPKQKICLFDKNEFIVQCLTGEYHREIDFDSFCRKSKIEQHKARIEELNIRLKQIEQTVINRLRKDYESEIQEGEKEVIEKEQLSIETILSSKEDGPNLTEITKIVSKIKKNYLYYHFLHGLQLDGWLNLAPKYIRDFDRICLEGEDSAKILRDILQEVKCLGQVMEIIVHPLKPYTIVGIVFPERNLAVWKGNPCRIEEQGFNTKHSTELTTMLETYKKARIELKSLVNDSVNFRGLDEMRNDLLSSILMDLRQD